MLRHTLATLAYRGGKAVRGLPAGMAGFRAGASSRSIGEILAHVGDLLDWALALAEGRHAWHDSQPLPWDAEVERFFRALASLDQRLQQPLKVPEEALFQGPIADALTHIGQICLLRRLAGSPVRGENYYLAKIQAGRVGPDQPPAIREVD